MPAALLALVAVASGAFAQAGGPVGAEAGTEQQGAAAAQPPTEGTVTEDIVVFGQRESFRASREERREALSLKEVVSGNEVGKLPDANIAEALHRVTSVYLVPDQGEGRYVSIRGVDPILNNTTLNGQLIAISDTDGRSGRAAPLDVLSSSSLSQLEVIKVTTPDMDGQSVGGTVNILTPSAFQRTFASVQAEGGDNSFNGDSGGIYSFDAQLAERFGGDQQWGVYIGANHSYREYQSQLYENPRAALPRTGPSVLLPDRVRFGGSTGDRERTGVNLNLQNQPSDQTSLWLRGFWTEYVDEELRPEFTIRNRGQLGAVSENEFFYTRYAIENEVRFERQERPVYQAVLGANHQVSSSWQLEGNVNLTQAKELNPFLNYYETETRSATSSLDDPDGAPIRFVLDDRGFATPTYNPALSGGLTPADPAFHRVTRLRNITSDVEEDTWTADGSATWFSQSADLPLWVKGGLKVVRRDKLVDDDDTRFPVLAPLTLADFGLGDSFEGVGRGKPYVHVPGQTLPVPSEGGYESFRATNPDAFGFDAAGSRANSVEDDYTLDERVTAGYLMASWDVTPIFNLTGGVRVEKTDVDVSAFSFVTRVSTELPPELSRIDELPFEQSDILDVSSSHDYTNALPSVMTRWNFRDDWQLRASISTNIGRPDYPDTAPISSLEVAEDPLSPGSFTASNEIGNPNLEPYEAINYDVSLDYYFRDNPGFFSIGAFYKDVDNAIYQFEDELRDFEFAGVLFDIYERSSLNNAEPGFISGVELAYQQDYTKLPGPWSGLGFSGNVAVIDSEVEVFQRPGEKLPFFNQADLVYNAQLYWERHGVFARVAVTHQSEAIFDTIGSNREDDIFRAPRTTLDAQVSYEFLQRYRVYVSGRNLTDEIDLTYRNRNEFFVAENPGFEVYGREIRVGFTWRGR